MTEKRNFTFNSEMAAKKLPYTKLLYKTNAMNWLTDKMFI